MDHWLKAEKQIVNQTYFSIETVTTNQNFYKSIENPNHLKP